MSKFQSECPSCGGEMSRKGGFQPVGLAGYDPRDLYASKPPVEILIKAEPFVCKECGFIALYDEGVLRRKRREERLKGGN